nr:MAG TPA: hypothetical protein [Caudoviricetes sp.]
MFKWRQELIIQKISLLLTMRVKYSRTEEIR